MNAVDTNVLVYRLDRNEPIKQSKARILLRQLSASSVPAILLWQVGAEFLQRLRRWEDQKVLTRRDTRRYMRAFRSFLPLTIPTQDVLDRALDLSDRYSLSHWDSMILGACLEAGVDTLYTEDMGAPITYAGVKLVNPFI